MRLTDDAMLVFARMMNEECQERSCPDCTFFIEQERKCLFDSRPVVWDALPDTPEEMANREWSVKPCPFCGGKAEMVTEYNDPFECGGVIYCVDCGAKIEFGCGGEVRLNAVEAWNRREKDDEC